MSVFGALQELSLPLPGLGGDAACAHGVHAHAAWGAGSGAHHLGAMAGLHVRQRGGGHGPGLGGARGRRRRVLRLGALGRGAVRRHVAHHVQGVVWERALLDRRAHHPHLDDAHHYHHERNGYEQARDRRPHVLESAAQRRASGIRTSTNISFSSHFLPSGSILLTSIQFVQSDNYMCRLAELPPLLGTIIVSQVTYYCLVE
jgi:hypothetical protein